MFQQKRPSTGTTQTKRRGKSGITPDEVLFASRWLLYVVSLGLLVALVIYLLSFLWEVGCLIAEAPAMITASGSDDHLMIIVVSLLDRAMVASLIILTVMGGHQIYIRRFRSRRRSDVPQWLDHVDTIMMKVKLGLAFTGISSVYLLKDLIDPSIVSHETLMVHILLHGTFLATTLVIALVWWMMNQGHEKSDIKLPLKKRVTKNPDSE